eukprot:7876264-Alexandrium_andersonii.AAC.1
MLHVRQFKLRAHAVWSRHWQTFALAQRMRSTLFWAGLQQRMPCRLELRSQNEIPFRACCSEDCCF